MITEQKNEFLLALGMPADMVAKLKGGLPGNDRSKASSGSGSSQSVPSSVPVLQAGKTAAKSKATMEEPGDDEIQVTAQKRLGVINYRGRAFTLLAMTDPVGAIVTGGKRPQGDLAKMNELGGTKRHRHQEGRGRLAGDARAPSQGRWKSL
jgi:hypothetical protein